MKNIRSESDISLLKHIVITLVWVSIHCESKMEKQDLQDGKVDDRIQIQQIARSRNKRQKETEI